MYNALLLRRDRWERVVLANHNDDGAGALRDLIGGNLGTCFQLPGSASHRVLIGWCDDDFVARDLAPSLYVPANIYVGGIVIHGPVVITTVRGPDTVSMTELEAAAIHCGKYAHLADGNVIPSLVFSPGYDVK